MQNATGDCTYLLAATYACLCQHQRVLPVMHLVRHCTRAWYDTSHTLCLCLCDAGAATPGGVRGEGPGGLAKAFHLLPPVQLQNLPQLVHHIPEHTHTDIGEHLQNPAKIISLLFCKMLLSCTLDVQASHVMLQMSSALHCGGKVVAGICLPAGFTALTASYCILEHAQASEIANGAMICEILLHPAC